MSTTPSSSTGAEAPTALAIYEAGTDRLLRVEVAQPDHAVDVERLAGFGFDARPLFPAAPAVTAQPVAWLIEDTEVPDRPQVTRHAERAAHYRDYLNGYVVTPLYALPAAPDTRPALDETHLGPHPAGYGMTKHKGPRSSCVDPECIDPTARDVLAAFLHEQSAEWERGETGQPVEFLYLADRLLAEVPSLAAALTERTPVQADPGVCTVCGSRGKAHDGLAHDEHERRLAELSGDPDLTERNTP